MRSWDETRIERIRRLQMKGEQKTRTEDQDLNLDKLLHESGSRQSSSFPVVFCFCFAKRKMKNLLCIVSHKAYTKPTQSPGIHFYNWTQINSTDIISLHLAFICLPPKSSFSYGLVKSNPFVWLSFVFALVFYNQSTKT